MFNLATLLAEQGAVQEAVDIMEKVLVCIFFFFFFYISLETRVE